MKERLEDLFEGCSELDQEIQDLQARSNAGIRFSYGVDYCMNNGISMFSDDEDAAVKVPTVQEPAGQLPNASADLVARLKGRLAALKKDSESLGQVSKTITTPAVRNCLAHIATTVIPDYRRFLLETSKGLQASPESYDIAETSHELEEVWDGQHLVTPALKAVKQYVKPGTPFSKAMLDDEQTAIDAVLGMLARYDTETGAHGLSWVANLFFNLYDQTPRTLPAYERVRMGISFLEKAQRYLGVQSNPHEYMKFFGPKRYATLMTKTEQERDLAVGKYHSNVLDEDVCKESSICVDTVRNYDMFCRSFFLNTNHPTYRSLFFQDLSLMEKLRNFLKFASVAKRNLTGLSDVQRCSVLNSSGQFITPHFSTGSQSIWVHNNPHYCIRIDNGQFKVSFLHKEPYDAHQGRWVRVGPAEWTADNQGWLLRERENEVLKYSEKDGFELLSPPGMIPFYQALWVSISRQQRLLGDAHM